MTWYTRSSFRNIKRGLFFDGSAPKVKTNMDMISWRKPRISDDIPWLIVPWWTPIQNEQYLFHSRPRRLQNFKIKRLNYILGEKKSYWKIMYKSCSSGFTRQLGIQTKLHIITVCFIRHHLQWSTIPQISNVRESKNIDKWFPRINITSRKAGFIWVAGIWVAKNVMKVALLNRVCWVPRRIQNSSREGSAPLRKDVSDRGTQTNFSRILVI